MLRATEMPMLNGVRVLVNPYLTEMYDDWSGVRAPSRAIRRMKRGYRQNIVRCMRPMAGIVKLPDGTLVCHPETYKALCERIDNA